MSKIIIFGTIGILVLAISLYFIIPKIKEKMTDDEKTIEKLDRNVCSPKCCLHSQWPVPHMQEDMKEMKEKYISTNLMCNNGEGGGCLCVNKDQAEYLANRGGNN